MYTCWPSNLGRPGTTDNADKGAYMMCGAFPRSCCRLPPCADIWLKVMPPAALFKKHFAGAPVFVQRLCMQCSDRSSIHFCLRGLRRLCEQRCDHYTHCHTNFRQFAKRLSKVCGPPRLRIEKKDVQTK